MTHTRHKQIFLLLFSIPAPPRSAACWCGGGSEEGHWAAGDWPRDEWSSAGITLTLGVWHKYFLFRNMLVVMSCWLTGVDFTPTSGSRTGQSFSFESGDGLYSLLLSFHFMTSHLMFPCSSKPSLPLSPGPSLHPGLRGAGRRQCHSPADREGCSWVQ